MPLISSTPSEVKKINEANIVKGKFDNTTTALLNIDKDKQLKTSFYKPIEEIRETFDRKISTPKRQLKETIVQDDQYFEFIKEEVECSCLIFNERQIGSNGRKNVSFNSDIEICHFQNNLDKTANQSNRINLKSESNFFVTLLNIFSI